MSLRRLREHYGDKNVALDRLPPAMYEWDLLFKKVGGNEADISLDSFSSGEKQLLNSTRRVRGQVPDSPCRMSKRKR